VPVRVHHRRAAALRLCQAVRPAPAPCEAAGRGGLSSGPAGHGGFRVRLQAAGRWGSRAGLRGVTSPRRAGMWARRACTRTRWRTSATPRARCAARACPSACAPPTRCSRRAAAARASELQVRGKRARLDTVLLVRRRRPRPCIGGDVVQKCGVPAGRAQACKPGGRLARRGGVGRASGGRPPGVRLLGRAYIYRVLKPCSRV